MTTILTPDGKTRDQVRMDLFALMPQTVALMYDALNDDEQEQFMCLSSKVKYSEDRELLELLEHAIRKGVRMNSLKAPQPLNIMDMPNMEFIGYVPNDETYNILPAAIYIEGVYENCIFAPNSYIGKKVVFKGTIGIGAHSVVCNASTRTTFPFDVVVAADDTTIFHCGLPMDKRTFPRGNALRVILETYKQKTQ
jgi:hypothetical protein